MISPARLTVSIILLLLLLSPAAGSSQGTDPTTAVAPAPDVCKACLDFERLNTMVRDGTISKAAARHELQRVLPAVRSEYYRRGGRDYGTETWVFPVAGKTAAAIGDGKSTGYAPRGYDWFDGNRHGGHPSYDIFIGHGADRRTPPGEQMPAVLSLTGGIVVAVENEWQPPSRLRGGKYIWIYDPAGEALVYYAHASAIHVSVGEIVSPGKIIATVGRTGYNAWKKRSPTHLHLTYLTVRNGQPTPKDIYPLLKKARTDPFPEGE